MRKLSLALSIACGVGIVLFLSLREPSLPHLDPSQVHAGSAARYLRFLVKEHGKKDRGRVQTTAYWSDGESQPGFSRLAELRQEGLNRTLVRVLEDQSAHEELRVGAVIALAWPLNRGALEPLLRRALDRHENNNIRKAVLLRLPRLGLPAPVSLRELLHEPFAGIDAAAAAALIMLGDLEAPSLVLEGLRDSTDDFLTGFLLQAAAKIPELLQTPFEKERRAYLDSDRRKRELALRSLEDLRALKDGEDFDFASAALLVYLPERRESQLAKLDRLARGLGKRLAGIQDPELKIQALNSYLLKGNISFVRYQGDPYHESFLFSVLRHDAGNCMGYASLYLALAERLDLPLKAVRMPHHLLVRWDDGTLRRNIELTERGKDLADDHFLAAGRGPLSICGEREVISAALSNRSSSRVEVEEFGAALEAADLAVFLDPRNFSAHLARALAVFETRLDASAEALDGLKRALDIDPSSFEAHAGRGGILRRMGKLDEALESMEEAARLAPADVRIRAERARCLSLLGQHAEALGALVEGEPEPGLSVVESELLARMEPEKALDLLTMEVSPDPLRFLATARGLLDPARGGVPRAKLALSALRWTARVIKDGEMVNAMDLGDPDLRDVPAFSHEDVPPEVTRDYHVLRARACLLLGQEGEARSALALAEAAGRPDRALLELRRSLP